MRAKRSGLAMVLGEDGRSGIGGADGARGLNLVTLANHPDEVAAFSAFQRPQSAADESFAAEASQYPDGARVILRSVSVTGVLSFALCGTRPSRPPARLQRELCRCEPLP
jgi:hypothetical protein